MPDVLNPATKAIDLCCWFPPTRRVPLPYDVQQRLDTHGEQKKLSKVIVQGLRSIWGPGRGSQRYFQLIPRRLAALWCRFVRLPGTSLPILHQRTDYSCCWALRGTAIHLRALLQARILD